MNNFSWAEISEISLSGQAQNYFSIGDEKDITVSGETLTVQIWGFNHDLIPSGGYAGITFGMKNLMANTRQMNSPASNTESFVGTDLYSYLNETVFNSMSSDLRNVIRPVNKKTSIGNESSVVQVDAMRIWIPSYCEVTDISNNRISNDEGTVYPIFPNKESLVKKLSNGVGSASIWWLRSPFLTEDYTFCIIFDDGFFGGRHTSTEQNGVCFGFCV